jgi:hypothetical protein
MDDLSNAAVLTMKALSMSDVVFLQEKYNHSIRVINCYLSNVIRTIICVEEKVFDIFPQFSLC